MLKKYAVALVCGLPVFAHASMALPMSCDATVKSFFAPLVQGNLIDKRPYMVDEHSLNHFRPKLFSGLSVYGMHVSSVVGYTDDPLLFIKRGGPVVGDVYGVIVRESIANVQAQLASVGATTAHTFRIDANSTAIACKGVIDENH